MMEQRESVGNMLFQAAETCWQGAIGAAREEISPVEGPASLAPYGQTKWSDWRTGSGVGRSLILFGSLRLPHVLDRDYNQPV